MATIIEMKGHPRWPLYKKLRRAAARELAELKTIIPGGRLEVTEGDVDEYLRIHLQGIQRDVRRFYRFDKGVREHYRKHERQRPAEMEEEGQ